MYYSKQTGFFYSREINGNQMPEDVVEITREEHVALLAGQSAGKVIVSDPRGMPVLQDALPSALTFEQQAEQERQWRDSVLAQAVWVRDRHRDQLEIGGSTTLTAEQFQELLVYTQALRDWPQSPDFPLTEHRPVAPPWIAEQHQ